VSITFPFEYRRIGDFTYHILSDPKEIKAYLMKWILREWESDHIQAPGEHWTVAWMDTLPRLEFALRVIRLGDICPNTDLMSVEEFQTSLKERADEREEAMLRGVSIEPLLVNGQGFELMDGYTRYTVLSRYEQEEVYAYVGFPSVTEATSSTGVVDSD
jgi:hypothetical protein